MDLNQVTVQSGNIAESIRFYTGLGLRLIVEAPHYARFECPVGESTFSVHLTDELKPSSGVIYFEVGNLLETVAALQARGVEFMRGPVEEPWLWHECRLADPSGNEICIYTAGGEPEEPSLENRLSGRTVGACNTVTSKSQGYDMYKVFGDMLSGNCYKIKLLMEFLGLDHEWVHVDILAGTTRTAEFLRMNPNARIPVLELPDGNFLWESNAILNYLAQDSRFLPQGRYQRAQVLQWQFFEQYSHEPYIAIARYIRKYLGLPADREAEYHARQPGGHKALALMEAHLADNDFFVDAGPTVADISLYAYTHVAPEGGFELSGYPNIRAWLSRIEQLPGYVTMSVENG